MAALESPVPVAATSAVAADPVAPARGAGAAVRTAAIVQWVVVGALLAYGVSQTAIKAAALFG